MAGERPKFAFGKTMIIGMGFFGISLIWPVFNAFVPLFLQAGNPVYTQQLVEAGREAPALVGFGLAPVVAAFVMTWDNLLNIFIAPWAGAQSDKTWNRFGRRKPWIIVGTPIAIIGFALLPLAHLSAPSTWALVAFMVCILLTNFGMALFRSPTVAWLGDLFPPDQRSQANGVINLMGGLGAAVALLGGGTIANALGEAAPFWVVAVLLTLSTLLVLWLVKEPETLERAHDKPTSSVLENLRLVWTTNNRSGFYVLLAILFWFIAYEAVQFGLSSFAVFSLGMTPGTASIFSTFFAATFLLFAVPSGIIGGRIGRRTTIMIGVTGLVLSFALGWLIIRDQTTYGAVLLVAGFFWALVNVNSLPLVYDYGDEAHIGAYTGLYYFSSQTAAVLGPVMAGALVQGLNNDYRMLWPFAALFMAAAWLAIRAVRPVEKLAVEPVASD